MSALAEMIDQAIGEVVADHPKLFAEKSIERTRKLLVRRIMKVLTGRQDTPDDGEKAEPALPTAGEPVPVNDPRAVAYCQLRAVAGAVAPVRFGDQIYLPREGDVSAVRPFADLPARAQWSFITDHRQLTAWREYFDEALPDVSRRSIIETRDGQAGAMLPWPWPPSKTGKVYEVPGAAA